MKGDRFQHLAGKTVQYAGIPLGLILCFAAAMLLPDSGRTAFPRYMLEIGGYVLIAVSAGLMVSRRNNKSTEE